MRYVLVLSPMLVVTACAGPGDLSLGVAEPRWAQRLEEAGRLPVGRVVAIDRFPDGTGTAVTQPGYVALPSWPTTTMPTLDTSAATGEVSKKGLLLYRHTVRLNTAAVQVVDADYELAVGDCVAVRSWKVGQQQVTQLVTALAGACDGVR